MTFLVNLGLSNQAFGGATSDSRHTQGYSGPYSNITVPGKKQQEKERKKKRKEKKRKEKKRKKENENYEKCWIIVAAESIIELTTISGSISGLK